MRFSGLAFFSVGLVLFLGIGCRTRPVVYSQSLEEVQSGNRIRGEPSFLVVGDTQRTLAVEARLLFREQNDPERTVLVKAMAATQAQFLVHLGDMVSDGSSDSEWRLFDQLFAPVVKQGLSVLPVMGITIILATCAWLVKTSRPGLLS